MKIIFCANECVPIHAKTLDERPLGGTETGVIYLAQELHKLGHQVTVLSKHENPPLSSPLYLPISAVPQLGAYDVFISIRDWKALFLPLKAKYRFLWTGDAFDQPSSIGIGDKRIAERIDLLLCVSQWHLDTLCEKSGFPRKKARVLRNGISWPLFQGQENRLRKRLLYSSTPYRGLVHLLSLFPKILERHPDAELHIFSGYDVYAGIEQYADKVMQEFKAMLQRFQRFPNVYIRGNLLQRDLAREFMRASVLAYPNTFAETSCISAMEAQAGGCVVVSTKRAALVETVADAGILIEGAPGQAAYDAAFVAAVDQLLSDDNLFQNLSQKGKARAEKEFGWNDVADKFCKEIVESFT